MQKLEKIQTPPEEKKDLDKDEISKVQFDRKRIIFSKIKRRLFRHVWVIRVGLLIGIFLLIFLGFLGLGRILGNTNLGFYLGLVRNFVLSPGEKIGNKDGVTNILILGKGGGGHEAPDLTDTIILVSVNHKDNSIHTISLPRDIWIKDLRTKLNSIYYWGNQKSDGGGLALAKAVVEEVTGQPVYYAVVLDFSSFKEIIDIIGGVNVNVVEGFTDEKFPITGKENDLCEGDKEYKCRYETISFEEGWQYMNGDMALKFVRSRNAEGDEGTDFAREKRQQLILSSIKQKILSKEILLSPKTLISLKNYILQKTETDVTASEAAILARWILAAGNKVSSTVLPEDLLERPSYSPKYDNLYVFVPRSGNWDKVYEWVECFLKNENCSRN
ncbi:hypothetical protein A2159_00075 [Candidatus Woesebacteria bacterium RBG_13_34_9]|uniref:Cell envelope-related transcriptional attenuator domain-containing protein n=1 Tax=Candidatus Woesebacteria bacterium RBG_13_34_9 TaxID=1802477 RepID=A0A1F7X384_9BACT|nr:MAG: hypothetical protein A2159_00075 [Candidatus Woesebacteria bacterium RBG_13_34_9]